MHVGLSVVQGLHRRDVPVGKPGRLRVGEHDVIHVGRVLQQAHGVTDFMGRGDSHAEAQAVALELGIQKNPDRHQELLPGGDGVHVGRAFALGAKRPSGWSTGSAWRDVFHPDDDIGRIGIAHHGGVPFVVEECRIFQVAMALRTKAGAPTLSSTQ